MRLIGFILVLVGCAPALAQEVSSTATTASTPEPVVVPPTNAPRALPTPVGQTFSRPESTFQSGGQTFSRPQSTFQSPVPPGIPVTRTFSQSEQGHFGSGVTFSSGGASFTRQVTVVPPTITTFIPVEEYLFEPIEALEQATPAESAPAPAATVLSAPQPETRPVVVDLPPGARIIRPAPAAAAQSASPVAQNKEE